MLTYKNIMITLLFIMAVGLSSWSIMMANFTHKKFYRNDPNLPDAIMKGVTLINLNAEGQPAIKLMTTQMKHYSIRNIIHITAPKVTVYRQSKEPWYIQSQTAIANDGIKKIRFLTDVIIQHVGDEQNPTTTLKTAALTIFPEQQIASTSDPVYFQQPNLTVTAKGVLANLKAGTIKLLNQTAGVYVPAS